MSRSLLVRIFIIGFLGGVILASLGLFVIFLAWEGGLILLMVFWRLFKNRMKEFFVESNFLKIHLPKSFLSAIILLALGFLLGYGRYWLALPDFSSSDLGFYRDLNIELKVQGWVVTEIDARADAQHFVLQTVQLFYHGSWLKVHGKLLIKAFRYPEYHFDEMMEASCILRSPPVFERFDYADILAKDDVFVVCYKPKIHVLSSLYEVDAAVHRGVIQQSHSQERDIQNHSGQEFWSLVYFLKGLLTTQINKIFTEPEASLVAGLLLGLRRTIPSTILDDFNRAGLTHVLAISGYNINMMITVFGLLFRFASRRGRFVGMLGGIILFLLFTGFSGSVIRAAWMGFFVILAVANGRKGQALHNLLLSGWVMVFLNPRVLVFDLSFELSFLATLGLVVIMPHFEKFFAKSRWFSKLPSFISEGLAVTLAAQVFTTPLILYYFGRFSLIAPFANIVFLPLIPLIMLFTFAALMLSFVYVPLAAPLVGISWVFLKILLIGVKIVAHLPFAAVDFS